MSYNGWNPLNYQSGNFIYQNTTSSPSFSSTGIGTQIDTQREEDVKYKPPGEPTLVQKKVTTLKLNPFAKKFDLPKTLPQSSSTSLTQVSAESETKILSSTTMVSGLNPSSSLPKHTLTQATQPLTSTTSSVSSTSIGIFSADPIEQGLVPTEAQILPPQARYHTTLHTNMLETNTIYGIYVSTSPIGEPCSFDYSNVILCEYQDNRARKMYASKYLHFKLNTEMPLWLEETNGTTPLLLYQSKFSGKKILQDTPHVFLDERRKLQLTWPMESNLTLNYEIWKMDANLRKDERVFSSQDGIIFNHLYNVPFNAFFEIQTGTGGQFESKPGIDGEEFEKEIGYHFNDPKLLDLVLNQNLIREYVGSNDAQERLEFLGNTILDFIIIKYWHDDPRLTQEHWLALQDLVDNKHGIQNLTILGIFKYTKLKIENKSVLKDNDNNRKPYMNLFEVILGAIYLDSGFDGVQAFYFKHFQKHLNETFQRSIEETASSKKDDTSEEDTSKFDPLISKSASKHVPVIPSQDTFEQFLEPYLQKLGYKFKNSEILKKLGSLQQANKQLRNLIFNSVDHEFINKAISEWENNKETSLMGKLSKRTISKWRDRTSLDLLPSATKDLIAKTLLDKETRKSTLDFSKFLTFSKYLKKSLIDIYLFKRFPEDTEENLTIKNGKLIAAFSSFPDEIVGAIFLDGGIQSIQSVMDTWCESTVKLLFVDELTTKKKDDQVMQVIRTAGMKAFAVEELASTRVITASKDDELVSTFAGLTLEKKDGGVHLIKKLYQHAILINRQLIVKRLLQINTHSFKAVVELSDHEVGIGMADTRLKAIATACFEIIKHIPEVEKQINIVDPKRKLDDYLQKQLIAGYQMQYKKIDDESCMLQVIISLNGQNISLSDKFSVSNGSIDSIQLKLKEMAQKALSIFDSSDTKRYQLQFRIGELRASQSSFLPDSANGTTQNQETMMWKQDLESIVAWQKSWTPFYISYEIDGGFRSVVYAGENDAGECLTAIGLGTNKKLSEQDAAKNFMSAIPKAVIEDYRLNKQKKKVRKK